MNKEQFDRLEKAVEHIERGEWSVPRFNFSEFSNENKDCGTAHCWAGELPHLFPEDWEWCGWWPTLRNGPRLIPNECLAAYFGLTEAETAKLFYPRDRRGGTPSGVLGDKATRQEVAANGRRFLEEKRRLMEAE